MDVFAVVGVDFGQRLSLPEGEAPRFGGSESRV